jgi:hypothetical protein
VESKQACRGGQQRNPLLDVRKYVHAITQMSATPSIDSRVRRASTFVPAFVGDGEVALPAPVSDVPPLDTGTVVFTVVIVGAGWDAPFVGEIVAMVGIVVVVAEGVLGAKALVAGPLAPETVGAI